MGLLALAKGLKTAWYAVKKPMPQGTVGAAVKGLVKKAGAAAGIVGTYSAADLIAGQMSKALSGPAGMGGLPALKGIGAAGGSLATLQRSGTSIQSVMPDVLDPSLLRTYYRAPKGYVIVRDPSAGTVMAVRKDVARAYKLWHAARKPPISAGDWHKYQTARGVEKKLLKIAAPALRKRQSRAPAGRRPRKGK